MAIRMVEDLGAPVAVVAVDLVTETTIPQYNEWAAYIMAAGGYVSAFMGWGGPFMKNVGIASFPWAAKKLYNRVRAGTVTTRARSRANVSRFSAPNPVTRSYQPEFEKVAPHAF